MTLRKRMKIKSTLENMESIQKNIIKNTGEEKKVRRKGIRTRNLMKNGDKIRKKKKNKKEKNIQSIGIDTITTKIIKNCMKRDLK